MDELQKCWMVPCIGQYLSLFREVFKFPEMDIEDLEESLMCTDSPLIQAVIISLLRACCRRKSIGFDDWETYLFQFLEKKWFRREGRKNPLSNGITYFHLGLKTKIDILYSLCLYRLDCPGVEIAMKAMDADALRVQSLGSDGLGNVYWYFYGTRLYKEEPSAKRKKDWEEEWNQQKISNSKKRKRGRAPKRKNSDDECDDSNNHNDGKNNVLSLNSKSRWSVVCATLVDWEVFAEKFKSSKMKCEMALYDILTKNFLPVLNDMYDDKEKRRRRKLLEFEPHKPTTRLGAKNLQKADSNNTNSNNESECTESEDDARKTRASRIEARIRKLEDSNLPDDPSWAEVQQLSDSTLDLDVANLEIGCHQSIFVKLRQVLTKVKIHKHSWPFRNAVDEAIAPGYYNIVKDPTDLSAIERKMQLKTYHTLSQVDRDMQQMVYNCRLYNGANSEYTDMAKNLLKLFRESLTEEMQSCPPLRKKRRMETKRLVKLRKTKQSGRYPQVEKDEVKKRRGRKKVRFQNMPGLEMLAEASEQALKEPNAGESETSQNQASPGKSKSFPDLKIVPIQHHTSYYLEKYSASSQSSSDSDSNRKDGLPSSSMGKSRNFGRNYRSHNILRHNNVFTKMIHANHVAESNYRRPVLSSVSSDQENHSIDRRSSSPRSYRDSDAMSPGSDSSTNAKCPEIPDLTRSELNDTCNALGISSDGTKNDALMSLSSLLCRIIKGSEFDVNEGENINYEDVDDRSSQAMEEPSIIDQDHQSIYSNDATEPRETSTPSEARRDASFRPLSNITTVDASILGISIDSNCPVDSSNSMTSKTSSDSPKYQARINDDGLLHEAHNSPDLPHSMSHSSPGHSYSSMSPHSVNNRQKSPLGESVLCNSDFAKTKPTSPDSQFQEFASELSPTSLESYGNMPSRISPTYFHISSQQNFAPGPMTNQSYNEAMGMSHEKDMPNSIPLQMPVPSEALPMLLSQTSSASSSIAFVPAISQHVVRPVPSFGGIPVASTTSSLPPNPLVSSSSSEAQVPMNQVDIVRTTNIIKCSSPKTKKRKRNIPIKPKPQQCTSTSIPVDVQNNIALNGHVVASDTFEHSSEFPIGLHSPPNKVSSSFSDTLSNSIMRSESFVPRDNMEHALMTSAPSSIEPKNCLSMPVLPPYMPSDNPFWSGKDIRPLHTVPVPHHIPVSHPVPIHPMFVTQGMTTTAASVNNYSCATARFPSIPAIPSTVPARCYESFNINPPNPLPSEGEINSKNMITMPSVVPNTLFPGFPVLYAMPSTVNSLHCQNSIREPLHFPRNLPIVKPPDAITTSAPTYITQDIQHRPVYAVNNLPCLPPFLLPHQQQLPPVLPTPIMATANGTAADDQHNQSKTLPVYTVLQNVPLKR